MKNELRFAELLWSRLGTPVAKACKKALDAGDYRTLAEMRVSPSTYQDAFTYFKDALAGSLLRKCKDLPIPDVDRAEQARKTFWEGEAACKRTNLRLAPYLSDAQKAPEGWDYEINEHIVAIRSIVRDVLGRAPHRAHVNGAFGPGATYSDPAKRATVGDKMNSRPSCTARFLEQWFPLWEITAWGRSCLSATAYRVPSIVLGGRFATAPKDAMKDRPIEAGPSLNVFFQLGLDRIIRPRLKRKGIDLDDGQDVHRQVACEASKTGLDATVDLKNASGTVSRSVVQLFTPTDWLTLFEELRSSHIRINNGWYRLEQFSGMGNGYTFCLESTIFYAIAQHAANLAGSKRRVYVYGDDVILGTEAVRYLFPLLSFFGFEVNVDKTFTEGPFRESCGGDYFQGYPVRPFFLKKVSLDAPDQIIAAANGLRRALSQDQWLLTECQVSWFALLDLLPSDIRRLRGPSDLGDSVVHDEPDRWLTKWKDDIRYVRTYRPVCEGFWPKVKLGQVPLTLFDDDVQYACALYGSADSGESGITLYGDDLQEIAGSRRLTSAGLRPRGAVTGYVQGWSAYS